MAAGGGGAWKVAYADFVTAMMAFFMVMWLVGQKEDAKQAIAHYFQDPFDDHEAHAAAHGHSQHPPKPHEKKGAEKTKSASDDPHHPLAKKSRILAVHGGDRAAFGAIVSFTGDSVQLDDAGKDLLTLAIPKFIGIPHKIEIRGHVSNRSAAKNDPWKLSYERSLSVMAYLVQNGIEPNRIRLAQAGAFEPLSITGSTEAMARNSRVDVFLLEEFAEDTVGTPQERELRTKDDAASTQGAGSPEHATSTEHPVSPAEKAVAPRTINPSTITESRPSSDSEAHSSGHHGHGAPPPAKAHAGH